MARHSRGRTALRPQNASAGPDIIHWRADPLILSRLPQAAHPSPQPRAIPSKPSLAIAALKVCTRMYQG